MRSKARASRPPRALLRGQKVLDGITGEDIFKNDSSTRFQRGMWVDKKQFDSLTDEERAEMISTR
jgi:hypothetical protein